MNVEVGEHKIIPNVAFKMPDEKEPLKEGEAAPVELTDEELIKRRKDMLKTMGFDETVAEDKAEEPPVEKTDEEKEAERVAAEADKGGKKPDETAEQKAAREQKEARAADRVAEEERQRKEDERTERVATATAKAVKEAIRTESKVEDPKSGQDIELTPDDQADLEAVAWLEQNNSAKLPKGVTAQKFIDYYKELYAYRDKWQKENEGKEFNAADDEHKEFLEKIQPDVPIEVIDDARDEVKFEKRFAAKVNPKLEAMEVEKTLEKAVPKINNSINSSIVKLAQAVCPDVHAVIAKDGKINLSKEAIAEAQKADPIGKAVLEDIIQKELQPAIVVLEQSAALGNKFPWDVKNVHHARVLDEIMACDEILSKAPAKVRIRDGKEFMPMAEYESQKSAIFASKASQAQKEAKIADLNAKHWVLTADDIAQTLIDNCSDKALKNINYLESLAAQRNGTDFVPRTKGAPAGKTAAPRQAAPAKAKPAPPKVGGGADLIAPPGKGNGGSKSFGETAAKVHFA